MPFELLLVKFRIWRHLKIREHFFSDFLPLLHYNNDNALKLCLISPRNSTFSLSCLHLLFCYSTVCMNNNFVFYLIVFTMISWYVFTIKLTCRRRSIPCVKKISKWSSKHQSDSLWIRLISNYDSSFLCCLWVWLFLSQSSASLILFTVVQYSLNKDNTSCNQHFSSWDTNSNFACFIVLWYTATGASMLQK